MAVLVLVLGSEGVVVSWAWCWFGGFGGWVWGVGRVGGGTELGTVSDMSVVMRCWTVMSEVGFRRSDAGACAGAGDLIWC